MRLTITLDDLSFDKLVFLSDKLDLSKSKVIECALNAYQVPASEHVRKYSKAASGRKNKLSESDLDFICSQLDAGCSVTDLSAQFDISRTTLYNYLKNRDIG